MAYRNKTYVAFASEDITSYQLMKAWKENANIEFDFVDAHDINTARDDSKAETIRKRLRERLANTKQSVVLLSSDAKRKSSDASTFFYYEVEVIEALNIPVVFANLDGSRVSVSKHIPTTLNSPYYTMSVSFQPKIIKHALDNYVDAFAANLKKDQPKVGPYYYKAKVYEELDL